MSEIRVVTWAMCEDFAQIAGKVDHLVNSARKFDINLELMGVGVKFECLKQKLHVLRDYLENIPADTYILAVDGFDCLFNRPLDGIIELFEKFETLVLMSCERVFTYQYHNYRDKFDEIPGPYKYVNSGTYMGKCRDLKDMLDYTLDFKSPDDTRIDQGLVAIWVYENMEDPSTVVLDTNCEMFWVTTDEWDILKEVAEKEETIFNPHTGTVPYVIHNLCNLYGAGLEAHEAAFKNIQQRWLNPK